MARTIPSTHLASRGDRRSLSAQAAPHWLLIHEGLHLGYRKSKRGGKWVVRCYDPETRKYTVEAIGTADDSSDADGIAVFDFRQAQEKARTKATQRAAEAAGEHVGDYTVAMAMEGYHKHMEQAEAATVKESCRRTELHILPTLGDLKVAKLTNTRLKDWHVGLVDQPGFTRGGAIRPRPDYMADEFEGDRRYTPQRTEYRRRRKDSANRVLTILKAGLNHAFMAGKVATNSAWAGDRLKAFETVSKARVHYLDRDEITRLINAAAPGFRELVQGALYTGARYGDLCNMDVGDFNVDAGIVMSGNSKASKPHAVNLTDEGVRFFSRITAGRDRTEPMFPHITNTRWGPSDQLRPMRAAVKAAKITTPISFHGLRHTYASHAVMAGITLMVVADNLGHADTRMVEKHYGHTAPAWKREEIRSKMPSWGDPGDDGKVAAIRAA